MYVPSSFKVSLSLRPLVRLSVTRSKNRGRTKYRNNEISMSLRTRGVNMLITFIVIREDIGTSIKQKTP